MNKLKNAISLSQQNVFAILIISNLHNILMYDYQKDNTIWFF